MIALDKVFNTDSLYIRPIRKADLDEMYLSTSSPEMWDYFTADLSNKEELEAWIESAINNKERLALTIIDKSHNKIIGSTSIGNISARDKRAEIGWTWIAKDYQGKGFNATVKYLLIKYLLEECGLERVELKTDVLNIPARKAMIKIGLVEEGILRSHTQMLNNRRRDTIYYSVLKGEWDELKNKNNWE